MKKEVRELIREMIAKGWSFSVCGSGHVRFTHPCGRKFVTSATPSDHRSLLNARAAIRRIERSISDNK